MASTRQFYNNYHREQFKIYIYNATTSAGYFPDTWKKATLKLIPKPGKSPALPSNITSWGSRENTGTRNQLQATHPSGAHRTVYLQSIRLQKKKRHNPSYSSHYRTNSPTQSRWRTVLCHPEGHNQSIRQSLAPWPKIQDTTSWTPYHHRTTPMRLPRRQGSKY